MQTFKGHFSTAKLEEILCLLDLMSQDDLPELLHSLSQNKKKSDDALVLLQMAIDNCAASPASTADEYTYACATTGDLVTDGITPFNITYAIKSSACAVAQKVSHLVTVESGGAVMSFADVQEFQKSDANFQATTAACGHHLAAHSVLVDLMLGEMALFTVEYCQCVQQLRPHFDLSLTVHYGETGGEAYLMALHILYWLTQQFLYYLSERKFGRHPSLPGFSAFLLQHLHTKTLDRFLGWLPASWLEQIHPRAATPAALGTQENWAARSGWGVSDPLMNMNYVISIKKHWQASGHSTIAQLLQAHTGEGAAPVPMVGDQPACLLWILKGRCFVNCPHVSTHKQASQALVTQVHSLLDACGVISSN